jgi:hypothetical protein
MCNEIFRALFTVTCESLISKPEKKTVCALHHLPVYIREAFSIKERQRRDIIFFHFFLLTHKVNAAIFFFLLHRKKLVLKRVCKKLERTVSIQEKKKQIFIVHTSIKGARSMVIAHRSEEVREGCLMKKEKVYW